MAHTFEFQVTTTVVVTVERTEGKFAPRDEISEAIRDALEDAVSNVGDEAHNADLDGIGADGDSVYEVTGVDVTSTDAFEVKS